MIFTHNNLVEIAYRWLLKNGGVGIAFKELVSIDREIPDVIGFNSSYSILIECKVSRSDFLCDKKKCHRAKGMGNWRFYCCPKGLIKKDELPEKWGLIYIDEKGRARIEYDCRLKRVKQENTSEWMKEQYGDFREYMARVDDNKFDADMEAERRIMYTALRRLFIKGYMKSIYDKKYSRKSPAELILFNDDSGLLVAQ